MKISDLIKGLDEDAFDWDMVSAKISKLTSIEEIYLVSAKISRKPLEIFPDYLSLEHKCEANPSYEKDKNLWSVLCNFQVSSYNADAPNQLVMKIEATFCASYLLKFIPEEIDLHELLGSMVFCTWAYSITNTWPYWREFVQSMSARIGYPALTVPLLETLPEPGKGSDKEAMETTISQVTKILEEFGFLHFENGKFRYTGPQRNKING